MSTTEQDDVVRNENFKLRVEAIVRDFMSDRDLTIKEAEAIEHALRNVLEIVIAKRVGAAMSGHVKELHTPWAVKGWGGIVRIVSLAAALAALFEISAHYLGGR